MKTLAICTLRQLTVAKNYITCVDKPWSIYSEIGPLQQKIVDLFEIGTET